MKRLARIWCWVGFHKWMYKACEQQLFPRLTVCRACVRWCGLEQRWNAPSGEWKKV